MWFGVKVLGVSGLGFGVGIWDLGFGVLVESNLCEGEFGFCGGRSEGCVAFGCEERLQGRGLRHVVGAIAN